MTPKTQNILSAIKGLEKSLKTDFKKKLEDTELALMVRNEDTVQKAKDGLKEEIKGVEDRLSTQIDGIAKGLDDLRTDNKVGADQIRDLRERVDKLESRQAA